MTRDRRDAAYNDIYSRLHGATRYRVARPNVVDAPTGPQPAWAIHERGIVLDAVNRHRAQHGLPPVDMTAIEAIDNNAAGHVDWLHKVALRAAFLAVGLDAPQEGATR